MSRREDFNKRRHWGYIAAHTMECLGKDHASCSPEHCGPDTYPLHWMTQEEIRVLLELADHLRGYHKPGVKRPKTGPREPDQEAPEPEYVPEPEYPPDQDEPDEDEFGVKLLTPEQMKLLERLKGKRAEQVKEGNRAKEVKGPKVPWHKPEHHTPRAEHTPNVTLEERPNGRGGFQNLHIPACSCGWGTELGYRSLGAATAAVNTHIRSAPKLPKEVKS